MSRVWTHLVLEVTLCDLEPGDISALLQEVRLEVHVVQLQLLELAALLQSLRVAASEQRLGQAALLHVAATAHLGQLQPAKHARNEANS